MDKYFSHFVPRPGFFLRVLFFFSIITILVVSSFFYKPTSSLPISIHADFANSTSCSAPKGSYVDSVRFIRYSDQNVALELIKQGKIAIYYFAIPLEVVAEMLNNPAVQIYDRTAGSFGILFNPAPSNDSSRSINPFQIREVRYAMNFLVNREFVVDEILKGYGSVLIDPFGQYSPEYLNLIETVESFGIRYNPTLAEKMIESGLTKVGAVKDETTGKWLFADNPITVKILIRSDDPRRKSLGDLVSY